MFKRILVPLDGSRLSGRALPCATEVARRFGAKLILLQVVVPAPMVVAPSPVDEGVSPIATEMAVRQARTQDKTNLERARRYLRGKLRSITARGIKGSYQVAVGTPVKSILDYCRKEKIDLVVMTTSGKSGLKRALMGSVADEVVRSPGFPVLVIRPRVLPRKGKK